MLAASRQLHCETLPGLIEGVGRQWGIQHSPQRLRRWLVFAVVVVSLGVFVRTVRNSALRKHGGESWWSHGVVNHRPKFLFDELQRAARSSDKKGRLPSDEDKVRALPSAPHSDDEVSEVANQTHLFSSHGTHGSVSSGINAHV